MFDLMAINNDLNSSELKKINDRISGSLKAINKNMFKVAYLFSNVKENELWIDDFDSMEEYADKCFGLKKSSMYNLIQIGDRFTIKSSDGQTYSCTLGNFSFGQVTQMISLDDKTITVGVTGGPHEQIMQEVAKVANAKGIPLPERFFLLSLLLYEA